jgi:hypothetical protein
MDHLNPANFTVLQPDLNPMRVKQGIGKKVLDDATGLFPGALVLFEDNGNVCSTRHVTAVPSIHKTYPLHRRVKNFFGLLLTITHGRKGMLAPVPIAPGSPAVWHSRLSAQSDEAIKAKMSWPER